MKLLIRLRAAWRAFKNPSYGVIGSYFGGQHCRGVTTFAGDAIDPKEVIRKVNWNGDATRKFKAR